MTQTQFSFPVYYEQEKINADSIVNYIQYVTCYFTESLGGLSRGCHNSFHWLLWAQCCHWICPVPGGIQSHQLSENSLFLNTKQSQRGQLQQYFFNVYSRICLNLDHQTKHNITSITNNSKDFLLKHDDLSHQLLSTQKFEQHLGKTGNRCSSMSKKKKKSTKQSN